MVEEGPAASEPRTAAAVALDIPGLEDAVEIGEGGFATVYRAFQPAFHRTVAVKVITNVNLDDAARQRFERECQTMGSLAEHPNIVTIYGAGFTDLGRPYLVMAFLPGGSLQDRIDAQGTLPWEESTEYAVHLAGALETAHRAQIIHRDIKPGNVMMSQYGEAQLTDFGIARVAGGHETRSGALAVSLAHAPPEVLDGKRPTALGDVYSLGSTVFETLWGKPAFEGEDNSLRVLLRRILRDPVPDLRTRGVPDEICTVIERSMAKNPEERQQSALQFGVELQAARTALGQDPGRLTVPDLRASGDDIHFVQATTSSLRSRGAVFDLDRRGPVDETADQTGVPSLAAAAGVTGAVGVPPPEPPRRRTALLVAAAVAAVVVAALLVGLVVQRGSQQQVATTSPTTASGQPEATDPPRTVVVADFGPKVQDTFVDSCVKNPVNPRSFCVCVYEEITKAMSYDRFVRLQASIAGGTPVEKTELQPIVERCSNAIPGRETTTVPPP
jgi:serine/threonine protein kinase